MAAIPANLASVLYNRTEGAIEILAVNTLGVLYIVETGDSVQSLADLRGKTVYATGKGSTPEYTLLYLLEKAGLDPEKDLTIEFKSEPTEVVALLKAQPTRWPCCRSPTSPPRRRRWRGCTSPLT